MGMSNGLRSALVFAFKTDPVLRSALNKVESLGAAVAIVEQAGCSVKSGGLMNFLQSEFALSVPLRLRVWLGEVMAPLGLELRVAANLHVWICGRMPLRGKVGKSKAENLYEDSSLPCAISRVALAKRLNLEQSCAENSSQPMHANGRL